MSVEESSKELLKESLSSQKEESASEGAPTERPSKSRVPVPKIRLNILLQRLGVCSRRKADELIADGKVKANGKTIRVLGTLVPENSSVTVDGKHYYQQTAHQTYIFHKPYRFLTTRADKNNRAIIFDLPQLKKLPQNVQPIGRLDYKSEGLLILTNDGNLSYALAHPKFLIPKTYNVLLSNLISKDDVTKIRKGVLLEDGFAKPKSVRLKARENLGRSLGQWIEITVTEGRNRLVRRMFEALAYKVVRLVRVSIGSVRLPAKLEPGDFRLTTEAENLYLQKIKETVETTPSLFDAPAKPSIRKRAKMRKVTLNDEEYARAAAFKDQILTKAIKARKEKTQKTKERKS